MNEERCCGNCQHFEDEDINGRGFCALTKALFGWSLCSDTCECWRERKMRLMGREPGKDHPTHLKHPQRNLIASG